MQSTMFNSSKLAILALFALQFSAVSFAHPTVEIEKRTPPIVMGLAKTFGAIAHTTLTSTGNTVITGACGTCPGTAITGFPPGVCTGGIFAGTTAACNAEAACLTAYNNAAALVPTVTIPTDLGGKVYPPGVYKFTTLNAVLSTTLTLNGTGHPNGQWIFQISTTFGSSANSKIVFLGGGQPCNVYFIIGSSATIGAGSQLQGNFLAYTSIAVSSAASDKGTLCALNGAITLIDDAITAQPTCTT